MKKNQEEPDTRTSELTILIVLPAGYDHLGDILTTAQANHSQVREGRMIQLCQSDLDSSFKYLGTSGIANWREYVISDPISVFLISGPSESSISSSLPAPFEFTSQPTGGRNCFSRQAWKDPMYSQVYSISCRQSAAQGIKDFLAGASCFNETALFTCCALCIIKPHVLDTHSGRIISLILQNGLEISALKCMRIDSLRLGKLLAAYRGIITGFKSFCDEILSGLSLVLEVRGENVVQRLRELAGPIDPAVAKHTSPDSIRAMFGQSVSQNALYCTDIAADGPFESRLFFANITN